MQGGEVRKGSALFIRHTTLSAKFARRAQLDGCCCCLFFLLFFLFFFSCYCCCYCSTVAGACCFTLAAFPRSIYTNANKHTHAHTLTHIHKCIYSTVHSTHTTLCYLHSAHVATLPLLLLLLLLLFSCSFLAIALLYTNFACDVNGAGALLSSLFYNSLSHPHTHSHIQIQVH